ncbi:MAG: hypothetical protein NZT92_12265 [Abditibacteriales bacterium]|nr:hypothetical protein [Abditibacteriales bacterium]MDW8366717.1 hypothetical protein [Abditibacteriales bacterium]
MFHGPRRQALSAIKAMLQPKMPPWFKQSKVDRLENVQRRRAVPSV